MNHFLARLRGEPVDEEILAGKQPQRAAADGRLEGVLIRRTEKRRTDTRADARHRLIEEEVSLGHAGTERAVTLINLSGGGAMIEGAFEASLFDSVDLFLGGTHQVPCVVKWLKDGRAGLEFLPGTQVTCTAAELSRLVTDVVRRTYPDLHVDDEPELPAEAPAPLQDGSRDGQRHGLVWSATLHYDFESAVVRLRNISASGALIEREGGLPLGAKPGLQIGKSAQLDCEVVWSFGDQAGLRFSKPFDVSLLRNSTPKLAHPQPADASRVGHLLELDQLSGDELQSYLEGFLKR